MAYSTIADYYQKQGKTLDKYNSPERTALATSAGITSGYVGSAAQNNQIVSYLNKQASTAITPQSLTPVKPAIIPTSPSPTNTTGLVDANNAGLVPTLPEGWTYADGKFTQTAPKTDTSTTSGLADIFKQYLGTQPTPPSLADTYAQQEQNAGIQAKQQAVQIYTNEVNSLVAQGTAGRLQVEGRDAPMGAILGEQAAIDRGIAIRALPVQAQLAAVQGDLQLAQTHLDKMFQIQAQDSQAQYEYKNRLIDSVFQFATEQEQTRLEQLRTEQTQNFTLKRDAMNQAADLANTAIANGQGALAGQIMALDSKSPTYTADVARLGGQIVVRPTGGYPSGVTPSGLTPEQQSDPFIKLLLSTAGGKPITDTFAQSLNKGLNVLGQIGGLQANIANTNTGPIAGAFRGANPWDTNAQTIKAQLNAIVPNLARGIYGEVGVLTDNDIKQYSKTLPTLTTTEDIRNAVLGITVDLIGKSIKRTLEINAA